MMKNIIKKEMYSSMGVQGDHLDTENFLEVCNFFNIPTYLLQHKLKQEDDTDKVKAGSTILGIDRYKDFLVVYDFDTVLSIDKSVYFIYNKNKNFHPKTVLEKVNFLDNQDRPHYQITQLFVEEKYSHRIVKVKPYVFSNYNRLKLIEYLKLQLQYYSIVDQNHLNEMVRLAIQEYHDTADQAKEPKGVSLLDKLPSDIFLVDIPISHILRDTIFGHLHPNASQVLECNRDFRTIREFDWNEYKVKLHVRDAKPANSSDYKSKSSKLFK